MNGTDTQMYADAARHVLADHCTPQVVRAIEADSGAGTAAANLWQALEAAGLPDALVSEAEGGAGLAMEQVFGVLEQCGAYAMPLLVGETMLARALLPAQSRPPGSIALARGEQQADGAWQCALVRGGRSADHVLVQTGGVWRLLPTARATRLPHALALDASMTWPAQHINAGLQISPEGGLDIRTLQASIIAPQMAGAMDSVLARTLQYANEREQFGRPIGKFQAIQHQLAVMSEHVCAARMAAQLGCSGPGARPDRLRVATAKARCSLAALIVAELAHAIHGAIGFTEEYDLQLYTRRLHAWRQAAGSEAYWNDVAGEALRGHAGLTLDILRRITDVQN